jgi:hypothetical protein
LTVVPKDRKYELVGGKFSRAHGLQCPMAGNQIAMIFWITYVMIVYMLNVIQ